MGKAGRFLSAFFHLVCLTVSNLPGRTVKSSANGLDAWNILCFNLLKSFIFIFLSLLIFPSFFVFIFLTVEYMGLAGVHELTPWRLH